MLNEVSHRTESFFSSTEFLQNFATSKQSFFVVGLEFENDLSREKSLLQFAEININLSKIVLHANELRTKFFSNWLCELVELNIIIEVDESKCTNVRILGLLEFFSFEVKVSLSSFSFAEKRKRS